MTAAQVRLRRHLDKLGRSPSRIADNLGSLGILGRRSAPTMCPIANYLRTKRYRSVTVGASVRTASIAISTPNPIRQFIHLFDNGAFPHLKGPM